MLFAIVVLPIGCLMAVHPSKFETTFINSTLIISIIGIMALLFSFLNLVYLSHALFRRRFVLKLDEEGLVFNLPAYRIFRCKWSELKSVNIYTYGKQKFIVFVLISTKRHKDLSGNFIGRTLVSRNTRLSGSPLFVAQGVINENIEDVLELVTQKLSTKKP